MWHKKILSILIKIKANKKKAIKIGLIVGATGAFVCSVYIFYWLKTKGSALAQTDYNNANTRIVCEEPIPIGIAIENTIDLLDKVYLTNQGDVLDTAKERVKDLITIINANGNGNICDFNKCTADPRNLGGTLSLGVSTGIGGIGEKKINIGEGWPPLCKNMGEPNNPKLCGGDPCGLSGLSHFIKKDEPQANNNSSDPTKYNGATLEDLAAALGAESNNIKEILEGKNKVVTEDIAQEDERVGETKISDTEYVLRYIDYVEKYWLTPSPLGNTCALSKTERERVKAGKMGEKYPKSCLAALADKTYSPKPWSETCEKECESGDLTNECRECLAECEGDSIFARINCKLYRKDSHEKCKNIPGATNKCCGEECADGLTPECYSCLCPKTAGNEKAAEQCLDWICGGSRSNWVCCHEEPIEQPVYYYIANQEFTSGGDVEITVTPTGEKVAKVTAGKKLTFQEAYKLFKDLTESYVPDLSVAYLLGNAYRESSFKREAGKCHMNDEKTNMKTEDKNALKKIAAELNLEPETLPLSCAGKIGHGGAMGPAQFMPTTWWGGTGNTSAPNSYKSKVEAKTGDKPANPWDFRDAFLASALFLQEHGANKKDVDSEKKALASYYGNISTDHYEVWVRMCYKKGFQELINNGCLDPTGPYLPMCKGAEIKLNAVCNKIRYNLDKAIDTIKFWD